MILFEGVARAKTVRDVKGERTKVFGLSIIFDRFLKRSQSKFEEAIEYYAQAEHLGSLTFYVAYGLSTCYTFKQDHAKAILYFRKAATLDRASPPGHFVLCNAFFQNGPFDE